jgi:hypothetical protein
MKTMRSNVNLWLGIVKLPYPEKKGSVLRMALTMAVADG